MPSPTSQDSLPPPCPPKSPRRKCAITRKPDIQNLPAIPTFRCNTGYTVAQAVRPAAPRQNIENPFSDPIARPNQTRRRSDNTIETKNDSVFDNSITETTTKPSIETDPTSNDNSSLYQNNHRPSPSQTFEVSATTDVEPFPDFTTPSPPESASQRNDEPERAHSKARTLVDKPKAALQYIEDMDQRFERWTGKMDEKRLRKKRQAQFRRDSITRAKEIDREHQVQIKAHRKKEKVRNKRAAKRLKEQEKEMKEQERRREKAAKDDFGFFGGLKMRICKRWHPDSESQETRVETASLEQTDTYHTAVSFIEREIEDDAAASQEVISGIA